MNVNTVVGEIYCVCAMSNFLMLHCTNPTQLWYAHHCTFNKFVTYFLLIITSNIL